MSPNQWVTPAHATAYLERPDPLHRGEGEAVLWELVPGSAGRVLDLGTGDGRLLARLRAHCRFEEAVALDVSPTMVDAARRRFAGDPTVSVIEHEARLAAGGRLRRRGLLLEVARTGAHGGDPSGLKLAVTAEGARPHDARPAQRVPCRPGDRRCELSRGS